MKNKIIFLILISLCSNLNAVEPKKEQNKIIKAYNKINNAYKFTKIHTNKKTLVPITLILGVTTYFLYRHNLIGVPYILAKTNEIAFNGAGKLTSGFIKSALKGTAEFINENPKDALILGAVLTAKTWVPKLTTSLIKIVFNLSPQLKIDLINLIIACGMEIIN
jgi:hypothetical protein